MKDRHNSAFSYQIDYFLLQVLENTNSAVFTTKKNFSSHNKKFGGGVFPRLINSTKQ